MLVAGLARRGGGPAVEFHGRPWVVCTGRRGEGSSDERMMLLLVSMTGVGDGVEGRWSLARPVRRGTAGEGRVHRRSKMRGWGLMDLKIMVVADW